MQTNSRLASLVLFVALFFASVIGLSQAVLASDGRPSDYVDFDTSLAQAKSFAKKGWHHDAVQELRKALTTSQGERSFDAHILLAQECFQEFDIGCSLTAADTARSLARTPDERNVAQNLLDYLNINFGKVEFRAGVGELTEGYLDLSTDDPILDQDVKRYYKEKVEPLATLRRTLPWIMYLPAVTYSLYGKEFTVEAGTESVVDAGFTPENSQPKAAVQAPLQQKFTLGLQIPLTADLSPGLLLTWTPIHFGKPSIGFEVPVIAGFKLADTGVWPTLATGVTLGGSIALPKSLALRWSGGFIGGLGAFSTRCGPLSGDPATVELTCGLEDGFPAVLMSPWAGPYGQLGVSGLKVGRARIGLSLQFFLELHPGFRSAGELNVTGSDGVKHVLPYRFPDGSAFQAVSVFGPSVSLDW